jgi:hypothetical protein
VVQPEWKKKEANMLNKRRSGSSMKSERETERGMIALVTSGVIVAVILLFVPLANSIAAETPSDSDAKCLACHSMQLTKSLEDGGQLSLHVPAADFTASVHSKFGCTSCHQDIVYSEHLRTRVAIDNERDYSVEQNQSCRNCHKRKFRQYEGSIHASLVADGNDAAPLCTDCHTAHKSVAVYEPLIGEPCKACHENIFDAYAQSVHGAARANGNMIRDSHIQAPACSDCHRAHDISAVAASDRLQSTCIDCHEGASLAHQDWLPNASLHLEVVACAACHAPMAERRIDLQLYDNLAQAPVGEDDSHAIFRDRIREIDTAGDGLDPIELWSLVRKTSQEGQATDVTLRGRMEVGTGVDAHRLAVKTSAVRDCQSCHQYGTDAFQNVTVSIARADGRKQRYQANSDVLNSVVSVDSVSNFYALGGTRVRLLDGLLILSVVAGLAIPLGHISMGKYLRKNASKEHEDAN